jgi:hypothetical protein
MHLSLEFSTRRLVITMPASLAGCHRTHCHRNKWVVELNSITPQQSPLVY